MSGLGEHIIMRDLKRRRAFQESFIMERDINRLRLRHLHNPCGMLGAALALAGACATAHTTLLSQTHCIDLVLWRDLEQIDYERMWLRFP